MRFWGEQGSIFRSRYLLAEGRVTLAKLEHSFNLCHTTKKRLCHLQKRHRPGILVDLAPLRTRQNETQKRCQAQLRIVMLFTRSHAVAVSQSLWPVFLELTQPELAIQPNWRLFVGTVGTYSSRYVEYISPDKPADVTTRSTLKPCSGFLLENFLCWIWRICTLYPL